MKLWESQQKALDETIKIMEEKKRCLLLAKVGAGKTFVSLSYAMNDDKRYTFIVPPGKRQDFFDDFKEFYNITPKKGKYINNIGKKIGRVRIPYGEYVRITKDGKSHITNYDTLDELPAGLVMRDRSRKAFTTQPGATMKHLPKLPLEDYCEQNGALIDKDGKVLINIVRTSKDLMFISEAKINIVSPQMYIELRKLLPMNYVIDEAHTIFAANKFSKAIVKHDTLLCMTATAISNHLQSWYRMLKIFGIKYTDVDFTKAKELYISEYYNSYTIPGLNLAHRITIPTDLKVSTEYMLSLHQDYQVIMKKEEIAKSERILTDVLFKPNNTVNTMLKLLKDHRVVYFDKDLPNFDPWLYKEHKVPIDLPDDFMAINHKITENIFKNMLLSGVAKVTNIKSNETREVMVDKSRYVKLANTINNIKQSVIFYTYKVEYDLIKKMISMAFPDAKIYSINGNVKDFKDNDGKSERHYTLCQYRSASEGINGLQYLYDNMVFFSIPLSAKNVSQAMGRIDRKGQVSSKVNYYRIIADNDNDKNNNERVIKGIKLQKRFYK